MKLYVIEEKSGFGIICFGTTRQLKDAEYPISMAKSHAILCADAGNTAQKCGLLPSELLQQRDELREALKQLVHLHGCEQEGLLSGQPTPEQWYKAAEQAEASIKNTETK